MNLREALELASFAVTVIGLPFAVWVFYLQHRKEREDEEEEACQRRAEGAHAVVMLDMLISLVERAFLVAWRPRVSASEQRR